ncbi:MAG TPA: heavy metal sensor histidine kinase [Bryobacteraceae bacterium]|nr:heavy metal sensor histidine kinase [Bryobacteraceae bacterium]
MSRPGNRIIRSLRFQLAAWYLAFFSLLFVLFGAFLYGTLARALEKRIDEALTAQVQTTARIFQDELEETPGKVRQAAREAVSETRFDGGTVAIFQGGSLLEASTAVPSSSLDAAAAQIAAGSAADQLLSLPHFGKNGARAAIHRAVIEGADPGITCLILAVQPLDSVAASLQVVRRVLFVGMPLLLALAGVGGYWLTTRRLAPLSWMAEQAHRITGNNLDTRLEIGNAAQELSMLSESFNELLSRLDQSFAGMKRFVADASHELRTPISVIRGEADVALSHERSPAEYRETLAIILDESRRLSRLVDDLLNLARADAGHVRIQPQDLYLNDLLADCCRSVQSLASARKIHLECQPAGDVPYRGDEELLRRLVVNLLDNAIRYTPPGGKVSAGLEANGNEVRVRVADTGIGIGPDAAPHVFERFYRADKARSRADGGFGLGLAIVKWIAESHHGAVELSSQPEMGSVFTVTLPR